MANLKRLPVKYIRDRAKSRYKKDPCCYICSSTGVLDLHHLYTVDVLVSKWLEKEKIKIETSEDIIAVRDDFIGQHEYEMFEYVRTLCRDCHKRLHSIYGQKPLLSTAPKQERWIDRQRAKFQG